MNNKFIIAIDAGSTFTKLGLINIKGEVEYFFDQKLPLSNPQINHFEHNPSEIIQSINQLLTLAVNKVGINNILGIGISNQRETIVVWDKNTGKEIYQAISWQDSRTKEICDDLSQYEDLFKSKTGLKINSYFSASKIKWILKNVSFPSIKDLYAGTIDSWIIWNLTNKQSFVTDITNASRTLLCNINTCQWDDELLNIFEIPKSILPEIKQNIDSFGFWEYEKHRIPILSSIGDQQSALLATGIKNTAICTYGTGVFLLQAIGTKIIHDDRLFTTIALKMNNQVFYAIEASIFNCGNVIEWLKKCDFIDGTCLDEDYQINNPTFFFNKSSCFSDQKDYLSSLVQINENKHKKHLLASSYLNIAFLVDEYVKHFQQISKQINNVFIAGKMSNNDFFMQWQSNISNVQLNKFDNCELSLLGAAFLVGIQINWWTLDDLMKLNISKKSFIPCLKEINKNKIIYCWIQYIKDNKKVLIL